MQTENCTDAPPGYVSVPGYERFDGSPKPATIPGVGPVRGVHSFGGNIFASRQSAEGDVIIWTSSPAGWQQVTPLHPDKPLPWLSSTYTGSRQIKYKPPNP